MPISRSVVQRRVTLGVHHVLIGPDVNEELDHGRVTQLSGNVHRCLASGVAPVLEEWELVVVQRGHVERDSVDFLLGSVVDKRREEGVASECRPWRGQ